MHRASPALTLQGAVAHCDMPVESGPTMLLPHSQRFTGGYLAFNRPEFVDYFAAHHVQLPLRKGDAVFFNPALAEDFGFLRKRAGHLVSKGRFLSAQLDAWLADDLWLRLARHANAMADRLSQGLAALPGAELAHPVEANEIFVRLPAAVADGLEAAGYRFYRWEGDLLRLVTAFDTPQAVVNSFLKIAKDLSEKA